MQTNTASLLVGTSSWREQFSEALKVSVGKLKILIFLEISILDWLIKMNHMFSKTKKKKVAKKVLNQVNQKVQVLLTISCISFHYSGSYYSLLFHLQVRLSFPHIIPDNFSFNYSLIDYFGGWACFVVSIFIIGVLTAVIGDLASHFGCTIGLKDSVTAISFVALGTSLPGKQNNLITRH